MSTEGTVYEVTGTISDRNGSSRVLRGRVEGIPKVDATLTKEGWSADAKAVGDALAGLIVVGSTEPPKGPILWFNTATAQTDAAALLSLDENESGYSVQASVNGETYGVENATVNQGATEGTYDFTVL